MRKGAGSKPCERAQVHLYRPGNALFFAGAPRIHPNARLITGVVCGVRGEGLADPLMQKIRWLDQLVAELARGKKMTSILRGPRRSGSPPGTAVGLLERRGSHSSMASMPCAARRSRWSLIARRCSGAWPCQFVISPVTRSGKRVR